MDHVTFDGQRWSNADADVVQLCDYDPQWPRRYEAEARQIRSALGTTLDFALEHFGSTAIPGLAAKPIIDIMLIASDPSRWPALIRPIEDLGYAFWSDNPRRDRMFFVKGMPPFGTGRTHHVHVRTPEDARSALVFRDYLAAPSRRGGALRRAEARPGRAPWDGSGRVRRRQDGVRRRRAGEGGTRRRVIPGSRGLGARRAMSRRERARRSPTRLTRQTGSRHAPILSVTSTNLGSRRGGG